MSCGNYTNANVSYFTNPNYPDTFGDPYSCTYKVNKVNNQVSYSVIFSDTWKFSNLLYTMVDLSIQSGFYRFRALESD